MKIIEMVKRATTLVGLFALLFMTFVPVAGAATMTGAKLTLTSSAPNPVTANHRFDFTHPSSTAVHHVNFMYCTTPSGACTTPPNMAGSSTGATDMTGGTVTYTWNAGSHWQQISFSAPANNTGAKYVQFNTVTNPDAGMFYIRISSHSSAGETANTIDSTVVAAATIAAVTITGTQRENLNVAVTSSTQSDATCAVGSGDGAFDATVDATSVNFGDFEAASASRVGGQRVEVDTNSTGGYALTLKTNQVLTNGTSDTVTDVAGGTTWSGGSTTGFGVCSYNEANHNDLTTWNGPFTLRTLASHTDPVDNDYTHVYFRVAVPGSQPSGTYSAVANYVVTPTY
jgi:hypothetical protein